MVIEMSIGAQSKLRILLVAREIMIPMMSSGFLKSYIAT